MMGTLRRQRPNSEKTAGEQTARMLEATRECLGHITLD